MKYKEIKNKFDSNDFIFHYHYSPGFSAKLCEYTLFVNSNLNFDLILNFYEKPIADFSQITKKNVLSKDIGDYRRHLYLKCKTPQVISEKLKHILANSFELKSSYLKESEIGKYASSGSSHKNSYINHKNGNFSINLGEGFDRNLVKTKAEFDFMDLIKLVDEWLDKISGDLMKFYGY